MILDSCFLSDDEDDTAELLAELQKIKKERAEEQAKKVGAVATLIMNICCI